MARPLMTSLFFRRQAAAPCNLTEKAARSRRSKATPGEGRTRCLLSSMTALRAA